MDKEIRENSALKYIEENLVKDAMSILSIDIRGYLSTNSFQFRLRQDGKEVKNKEKWLYKLLTTTQEGVSRIWYPREILSYVYDEEQRQIYLLQDLGEARIGKKPSLIDTYVIENQLLFVEEHIVARTSTTLHFPMNASYSTYEILREQYTEEELKKYLPNTNKDSKIAMTASGIEYYVDEITKGQPLINCLINREFNPQWEEKEPHKHKVLFELQGLYIKLNGENINISRELLNEINKK